MSDTLPPRTADSHLALTLLGLGALICDRLGAEAIPMGSEYRDRLLALSGQAFDPAGWEDWLARWSKRGPHLPLDRLAAAGIDARSRAILLTAGLVGEDPRFAPALGEHGHVSHGALVALWREFDGRDEPRAVGSAVARLVGCGLLEPVGRDGPRLEREFRVPDVIWDALAGEDAAPAGCTLLRPASLPRLDELVLAEAVRDRAWALVREWRVHPGLALLVRGPGGNGRQALVSAMAAALDRPLLVAEAGVADDPVCWRRAGLLALLADAVLVIAPELVHGEMRVLPPFPLGPVRLAIIAGEGGGVRLNDNPAATLVLPVPDGVERQRLWEMALPGANGEALSGGLRLGSGTLLRAASAAQLLARQAGRSVPHAQDLRLGLRHLQDCRLEAVATLLDGGDAEPEFLALDAATSEELDALVTRCRHRETLARFAGSGPGGLGVRALFAGPSGAGKSLAARWLGHALGRDVWRVDLSATVSKFIGETEKSLDRAFAAAEELDVVLLLDEGDALMARRTDVGNANDRYANLETNFLLQRVESYAGILVVTSNAADRIDKAFQRRMDVVVPFRAPDELRRYEILANLLGDHAVDNDLVEEVAVRCELSGGQLRNVALHARLLALEAGCAAGRVRDGHLRRAVLREYRKLEAPCPLKPVLSAAI